MEFKKIAQNEEFLQTVNEFVIKKQSHLNINGFAENNRLINKQNLQ